MQNLFDDNERFELERRLADLGPRQEHRPGDRRASVVLALIDRDEPSCILIWRVDRGVHGGQISFPGGSIDQGDATSWDAGRREFEEELGHAAPRDSLGFLGEYNTKVSSFRVEVHVALIDEESTWQPAPDEVRGILEVPLRVLSDAEQDHEAVTRAWELPITFGYDFDPSPFVVSGETPVHGRGQRLNREGMDVAVPLIWGLTARALFDFLHRVWGPYQAERRARKDSS